MQKLEISLKFIGFWFEKNETYSE